MPEFYAKQKDNTATLTTTLYTILQASTDLHHIRATYKADPTFKPDQYTELEGIYYTNDNKIVIPNNPELKEYIISQSHDTLSAFPLT